MMVARPLISYQRCGFAADPKEMVDPIEKLTGSGGSKKITAQTLCEITGTKYYIHNEEIDFSASKILTVYDENDVLIGDLTFEEALTSAKSAQKDLVLRNARNEPPVVKIMNYKKELLKKLFKKLGKAPITEKEQKQKAIRLSTTISMHDLENKKRKGIDFLK